MPAMGRKASGDGSLRYAIVAAIKKQPIGSIKTAGLAVIWPLMVKKSNKTERVLHSAVVKMKITAIL